MTVPLGDSTEYTHIWQNAFQIKDTRQKPEALRWYEPDCIPGPNSSCLGTEPALINNFAQPGGDLELFAYRHNADGLIQTKGILDVSAATSGTIAWVMPGTVSGELQFIPVTAGNDSFSLRVTTTGDQTGITNASAYIDKSTGEVTVSWSSGGCCPAWIVVYDDLPYGQGISTTSTGDLLQYPYIDWSDNAGGIFNYVRSASTIGASNNYAPELLADGVYSFTAVEACENIGNGGKDFKIRFNLNVAGMYPGGNGGTPTALRDEPWYANATGFSDANFYFARTWVLPIKASGGTTVVPSIRIIKTSADAATWTATLRNRLFITYLGDLVHASSFSNHNDPYPATP